MKNIFMKKVYCVFSFVLLFAMSSFAAVTEGVDYDANGGCSFSIKTANGLMNIGEIPAGECASPVYELETDVVLGSSKPTASCVTNWDNSKASFKGTLNGKGRKISGVCLNEVDVQKLTLFDVSAGAVIFNLDFENIYIHGEQNSMYGDFVPALFAGNTNVNSDLITFSSLNISNVSISLASGGAIGNIGMLVARAGNPMIVNQVNVENSSVSILGNSSSQYIGGLFGNLNSKKLIVSGSNIKMDIEGSATSSAYFYVGGILGYTSSVDTLNFSNDSVEGSINILSGYSVYCGGFIGSVSRSKAVYTISHSSFIGDMNFSVSNYYSYAGGIIGEVGYSSGSTLTLDSVSVKSRNGYSSPFIDIKGCGYMYYVGGLIGENYFDANVTDCSVEGSIIESIPNANSGYISGMVGYSSRKLTVSNSHFIGSLPVSYDTYGIAYNYESTSSYSDSYVINFANNHKGLVPSSSVKLLHIVGIGASLDEPLMFYDGSTELGYATLNSPAYAYMTGKTFDTDGTIRNPLEGEEKVHRVMGIFSTDTLFDLYTDKNGHIAYSADGSSFGSAELNKIVWPSQWIVNWRPSLSTKYTADTTFSMAVVEGLDYVVDGCNVSLLRSPALLNIGKIPLNGCENPVYNLETDVVLSTAAVSSSCSPNWNQDGKTFKGTLNGNGHVVKGICHIAKDYSDFSLFSIYGNTSISDLTFENVYMNNEYETGGSDWNVGVFNVGSDKSVKHEFKNVTINNIWMFGHNASKITRIGTLIGAANGEILIDHVNVIDAYISSTSMRTYLGGIVGDMEYGMLSIDKSNVSGTLLATSSSYDAKAGGLVGRVNPYTTNVLITNSVGNAEVSASSSFGAAAGGLVGELMSTDAKLAKNKSIKTVSAAANSEQRAGGLIGYMGGVSSFESRDDSVSAKVSAGRYKATDQVLDIGGLIGQIYSYNTSVNDFINPVFSGRVSNTDSLRSAGYLGGVIGRIYNNSSGNISQLNISGATVRSSNGKIDTLIYGTTKNLQNCYFGGLVGYSYAHTNISNSFVYGSINIRRNTKNSYNNDYVTGLVGFVPTATNLYVRKSVFVGKLDHGFVTQGLAYGGSSSGRSVEDSYAIDLNGNATLVWNWTPDRVRVAEVSSTLDGDMTFYTGSSPLATYKPNSPKFAHFIGLAFDESLGFAVPASEKLAPVYHIYAARQSGAAVYDFYTNGEGRIAYNPDGSAVSAADLAAIEYPAGWPADKKASLSKVYTEDDFVVEPLGSDSYEIAECTVFIKKFEALMSPEKIDIPSNCSYVEYKLANDIVVSKEKQDVGCTSNWINTFATMKKGTFNGEGHTISGICLNETDSSEVYLWNLKGMFSVSNVNLENIYVGVDRGTDNVEYRASIFKVDTAYMENNFKDISLEGVTVEAHGGTNKDGYAAWLMAYGNRGSVYFDRVHVKNSSIIASGSINVGGFAGFSSKNTYVRNSDVQGYINVKSMSNRAKVGGLIGSFGGSTSATGVVEESSFDGEIDIDCYGSVYAGGILGYHSSSFYFRASDVKVSSGKGYAGTLINAKSGSAESAIGGIIGSARSVGISDSYVEGRIAYSRISSSSFNASYVGGVVGVCSVSSNSISGVNFVGYLPEGQESNDYRYGVGYCSGSVLNSYAIDLNSAAKSLGRSMESKKSAMVNVSDLTKPATVYYDGMILNDVSLQTPAVAYSVGQVYKPGSNYNLPMNRVLSHDSLTHLIRWSSCEDTTIILSVYTNHEGKLGYFADGTPFTKDDVPEGLCTEPNFDFVYKSDVTHGISVPYNKTDFAVDGCVTSIKTQAALFGIENVPYERSCENVTLKLEKDFDFGATSTEAGCTSNWDIQNIVFGDKFDFDGNNHTIRGICLNNGEKAAYLFGGGKGGKIHNLTLEDIYLKGESTTDVVEVSLSSGNFQWENVTINNVTIESDCNANKNCYAGLLSASLPYTSVSSTKATNVTINVAGGLNVFVGGFIGSLDSHIPSLNFDNNLFEGSINVNSPANADAYIGGLMGYQGGNYMRTAWNDTIRAQINVDLKKGYIGGFFGLSESIIATNRASNLIFDGCISGSIASDATVGGIVGRLPDSGGQWSGLFDGVLVKGSGSAGKLFDFSRMSGNVGGIVGNSGANAPDTKRAYVNGIFDISSDGSASVGGFYGSGSGTIRNSVLIGTFNLSGKSSAGAFGGGESTLFNGYIRASHSYAVVDGSELQPENDLYYSSVINTSDERAVVYLEDGLRDTVVARSAAFAHLLNSGMNGDDSDDDNYGVDDDSDDEDCFEEDECGDEPEDDDFEWAAAPKVLRAPPIMKAPDPVSYEGFYYDPNENEGYPSIISNGELPTFKVSWQIDGKPSSVAYTDKFGQLAYAADGSSLFDEVGEPVDGNEIPLKTLTKKKTSEDELDSIITWVNVKNENLLWDESRSFSQDVVYVRMAAPAPHETEFTVTLGDISKYKPFFQPQEIPSKFTVAEVLALPEVGAMGLCQTGWDIYRDGDLYTSITEKINGEYLWVSAVGFSGDIVVTPTFEAGNCATRSVTVSLVEDHDGAAVSDLVKLVVKYGNEVLPVNNGKVTVPYVKGLNLDYELSETDKQAHRIVGVSVNGNAVKSSGSIEIEENIVFNVSLRNASDIHDSYSIAQVDFRVNGSAARLDVVVDKMDAEFPVELIASLYADSVWIKDTLLTDDAEAKTYAMNFFPLSPDKKYYVEIMLHGAGEPVTKASREVEISAVARTVESGSWYMLSMAGVAESYKFPDYNDAAFYSWNEDFPIGEYMQYQRLSSVKDVDVAAGYWIYTSEPLVLEPTSAESVEDSIRWELKSHYTGWNLVANPYSWMLKVGDFHFEDPEDTTQVPWKWNSKNQRYVVANELDVYEAMWVYAAENSELALSSEPYFADSISYAGKKAAKKASRNSWSLRLDLEGENGMADSWNVIGLGSRDISLMKPPVAVGEALSLEIKDGNKALAKSIKSSGDLSWNVEFASSKPQVAKLSVTGLADLEQLGLNAYLEMDGSVVQLSSAEPLEISLGSSTKRAVLKVSSSPVVAKTKGVGDLRYSVRDGNLTVSFLLTKSSANPTVVTLYDALGHVLLQKREESYAGLHEVSFHKVHHSGIGILKISAGDETLTGRLKF